MPSKVCLTQRPVPGSEENEFVRSPARFIRERSQGTGKTKGSEQRFDEWARSFQVQFATQEKHTLQGGRPEFAAARELAAEWAEHAIRRKTAKNKATIKDLVNRFWTLVDQVLADRGESTVSSKGRLPPIRPQGKYHNLNDVLAAINSTYFEDKLTCRITWSNRVGGLSFHSVRKDPVTGEEFHLISISKGYDAANCPEYAVAGVVYHECLHIAIPVEIRNGRRVVHGRNFRVRERQYIYYDEWIRWHNQVLPKNIWAMRRGKEL